MVAHPVSDRTQPCLTSVKLMELAGPLGHSPRSVTCNTETQNTDNDDKNLCLCKTFKLTMCIINKIVQILSIRILSINT